MPASQLRLAAIAGLLTTGIAFAQTDDTSLAPVAPPVPSDIHAPGYAEGTYLYEPRHADAPQYVPPGQEARPAYGHPDSRTDRNRAAESAFNGRNPGARRDPNPDDFATGIYNPKP